MSNQIVSTAQPNDLDTVYQPELTGRDIDLLGQCFDAVVKGMGVQFPRNGWDTLDRLVAPRLAALKDKAS